MNVASESAEAAAVEGIPYETYAAVYKQLQHTVLGLVRAALEHARRSTPAGSTLPSSTGHAPRADSTLSAREREVLQRIVAGDSNKMIARTLGLSPHTVKRHVANILGKLGARSRAQAAAWLLARH
jgi:LuxR family maltose regulon positive regulatory protein